MKIALLSGAYKNAGDFLITKRSEELLKFCLKDVEIVKFLRSEAGSNIESINECDAVVFCGGPIYLKNVERYLPSVFFNGKIKVPMMILGGGWYGKDSESIYKYRFSELTKVFFAKIDRELGLSCRDWHTMKTLGKESFSSLTMTGCPAWYSIEHMSLNSLVVKPWSEIKNICVSDPADGKNYGLLLDLIEYLAGRYPSSAIKLICHRGLKFSNEIAESIKTKNVEIVDISNDSSGFSLYDQCDLHVGFRVHAHIYNLSVRNRTVLIEEDGRGGGVNDALGLVGVKAYGNSTWLRRKINKILKLPVNRNPYFINEIDSVFARLEQTGDKPLENAFVLMQKQFSYMKEFILRLESIGSHLKKKE